jgi:hypothetical protein
MQFVFAILAIACFSQALCNTIVSFDKAPGKASNGFGGSSVKVESSNKNANVNDINIGSGAGTDHSGISMPSIKLPKVDVPSPAWDTDEVKIDWSDDKSDKSDKSKSGHRGEKRQWRKHPKKWDKKQDSSSSSSSDEGTTTPSTTTAALENPTVPTTTTTTTAAPTTTVSPNCTCQINSILSNNFGTQTCTFWSDDAKAHCDQKGYSVCRAVCVAAMALNWETCTPTQATILFCTCPILRFRGAHFEVPYTIPPTSRVFYDARYKTCYRQCRESSETEESTYESKDKSSPYLKKKLL